MHILMYQIFLFLQQTNLDKNFVRR